MTKEEIRELSEKVASGVASEEEILTYNRLLNSFSSADFEWDEKLHGTKKEIESSMRKTIHKKAEISKPPVPVKWLRWAASAAAVLLIGFGFYNVFVNNNQKAAIVKTAQQKPAPKKENLPGGEKAILTLADGSAIILDSAQNGTIATQGTIKVIKLNGKLAYNAAASGPAEIAFNTISTPRGGTYQIELSDGSKVWLNAASSLRFPASFSGKQRNVEIKGEAYFEVTKNTAMPFIVKVNNSNVEVLGTHFNVMAYNDESVLKTTLLEGAVKFVNGSNKMFLKPGQQSLLSENGQLQLINDVNVSDVIAWKEGLFHFENADIETVMRQLSRWYDVDIIYENKTTDDSFYLEMPRSSKLADVLKVLELSAGIHFETEGRKIKVKT